MNTLKNRACENCTWLMGKQLVKPTETVDLHTAIHADQNMLENMALNAVAIVDVELMILTSGE